MSDTARRITNARSRPSSRCRGAVRPQPETMEQEALVVQGRVGRQEQRRQIGRDGQVLTRCQAAGSRLLWHGRGAWRPGELVVIDNATGEVAARHKAPGATFLNDVTAAEDGRVFVSDMMQNQIWKVDGDQFEMWLQDEALENPRVCSPSRVVWWSPPGASRKGTSRPMCPATSGGRLPEQGDHEHRAR